MDQRRRQRTKLGNSARGLLGIAKALTGGFEMAMTATPSFPTSMVTVALAMAFPRR